MRADPNLPTIYQADLAYVHDAGFGHLAENAAPWAIEALHRAGIQEGVIVDLGCGSGIVSRIFRDAGFRVVGVDLSASAVALARKRLPDVEFHISSFAEFFFPPCVAVTAIGEVFNYAADPRNNAAARATVLSRIYTALVPGGIFLFDAASLKRAPASGQQRTFTQNQDWAVLVEVEVDTACRLLTRHITTFCREEGELFRRGNETHLLQLLEPEDMLDLLQEIGFSASVLDSYGALPLPQGLHAYIAMKPRESA